MAIQGMVELSEIFSPNSTNLFVRLRNIFIQCRNPNVEIHSPAVRRVGASILRISGYILGDLKMCKKEMRFVRFLNVNPHLLYFSCAHASAGCVLPFRKVSSLNHVPPPPDEAFVHYWKMCADECVFLCLGSG